MDIDSIADEVIRSPGSISCITEKNISSILDNVTCILADDNVLVDISKPVVFVGDSHGDFESTRAVVDRYLDTDRVIVFLGDYVDRAPIEYGSVYNVTYLLILKYRYPDRFILLKGNHEAYNVIPFYPYSFRDEVVRCFGSSRLHDKYLEAFSALPLMVMAHRVYGAHGGFVPGYKKDKLLTIDKNDKYSVEMIAWSDPCISPTYRGVGHHFKEEELTSFLRGLDARVFIKGHDYHTLGMSIYNDQCLTIFTSRLYKDEGNKGILVAEIDKTVGRLDDIRVMDYSSGEWVRYNVKRVIDLE